MPFVYHSGMGQPDKEPFKGGEQEPWIHTGGLHAELRVGKDLLQTQYAIKCELLVGDYVLWRCSWLSLSFKQSNFHFV